MSNVEQLKSISVLALARALAPVVVAGVGLTAAPAQAQSACLPIAGIDIICTGGPATPGTPVLDLAPITGPVVATLGDGFQSLAAVNLSTLGTAADVTIDSLGSAVIDTADQAGLTVDAGGAVTGQVSSITTSGTGATGAVLRAVDGVLFSVSDLVETVGDAAPARDIEGSTVSVDANVIRTGGAGSNGAQLVALDGPVDLDANLIETAGDLSTAALLRSAGDVNLNVGVLRTQGAQALGIDIATDSAACILLGTNGCDVTAAADQITTGGFGGIGALVSAATGVTTVDVGVLQTGGDEAAGLNLSTDPTVCAALGAGACDQNFTVGELVTGGARSPGALVRAAGNVTGNVGILRTGGEDAVGLDLASDPSACLLLGAGACGTSFNVGELTTSGAGATGILARVVGPTALRVGLLETLGDAATGIDIAADPTACALLGSGACDVDVGADRVTTSGDGAAAVLIAAPANILADLGVISTSGDDAAGLAIVTDPAACLVLGPGSCGITAAVDDVDTGGDNSPGVDVDGGDDPIDVDTGTVDTGGDNSPGVDVTGEGPITVDTGPINTGGDNSPGIVVDGGTGPVVVDAGPITTGGGNSPGIIVETDSGDQTIVAGPITVTGPGSDGIVATSPGCSAINITARGAISSGQGTGILASSACSVVVTTLPGAAVTGLVAGIDVTSGTGATITIGDAVSSGAGPALDVDGAPATVMIMPTGTVAGYVDLTDGDDLLTNAGRFDATADSAFGGGSDRFVNTGTLAVRPGATAAGGVTLTGLESFENSGLIDMRNTVLGDTLTVPGNFVGSGGSTLAVDIPGSGTGIADRLIVGGSATGTTRVVLNPLSQGVGLLLDRQVIVDAGAGSTPEAFVLAGETATVGLVAYSLGFDPTTNDYAVSGTPSDQAYGLLRVAEGARQIQYRGNDAWSGHMRSLRDGRGVGDGDGRRGSALWGQMFGAGTRLDNARDVTVFGQTRTVATNSRQDYFGGQVGYDFGGVTAENGAVFGATAGYTNSTITFAPRSSQFRFDAINVGAYGAFSSGGFFANLLGRYEWYDVRATLPGIDRRKFDGKGYGAKAEVGMRFGQSAFFVEPAASIEYARTDLDRLDAGVTTIAFDDGDGLRGTAGLRIGADAFKGDTRIRFYASGSVVHEFEGRNALRFLNGGQSLALAEGRIGTYGRGVVGFNAVTASRVSGFIEATGDIGDGYRSGGARAGINVRF
ncbi:autotransporter domain-containing protein [Sphingomonas sp.]|uniref:autotransporter domain-containing protein n=1 Tax=Sphingomonas sp. TaxID=28214 RepID=UPI003B3A9E9F